MYWWIIDEVILVFNPDTEHAYAPMSITQCYIFLAKVVQENLQGIPNPK
jgi:hypothetical protein